MNKRILQIAEQAGSTHKHSLGVYQFYADELDKFAKLIAKECIRLCDQVDYVGADECMDNIKKHFGIE